MANYAYVIAVDGNSLSDIVQSFNDCIKNKFYSPIAYKDFQRIKKFEGEVEIRFAKDNGMVMIVPTDLTLSMLWCGNKNDGSLGEFLWNYFEEELKEMYKEDNLKINKEINKAEYKYDLFGVAECSAANCHAYGTKTEVDSDLSVCTDAVTAKTAIPQSYFYNDYDCATIASTSTSTSIETPLDKVKERVEELGKLVQDSVTAIEEQLCTKVNIDEMHYHVKNYSDDLLEDIDSARWDIHLLLDKVAALEDQLAHLQKISAQGTSSNVYPVKTYNIKADISSSCDNRKEKKNMDTNKMFNGFEFGPVDDRIKMSPYGMAIRNADGRYVSYDAKNGNIVDVEVFNFDNHNLIYKMPVAVSAIAVGDTVIHMKKPMFVTNVTNGITAIDIFNGEIKTIMPATNMFGFNFVTKVVSLFNFTGANAPTAENPFGNILPFMLMNEGGDFKDMLPLMLMMNGNGMDNFMQNPLMMYMLMKDSDGVGDVLPFLMMGQPGLFGQAPAHTCNCGRQPNGENHQ